MASPPWKETDDSLFLHCVGLDGIALYYWTAWLWSVVLKIVLLPKQEENEPVGRGVHSDTSPPPYQPAFVSGITLLPFVLLQTLTCYYSAYGEKSLWALQGETWPVSESQWKIWDGGSQVWGGHWGCIALWCCCHAVHAASSSSREGPSLPAVLIALVACGWWLADNRLDSRSGWRAPSPPSSLHCWPWPQIPSHSKVQGVYSPCKMKFGGKVNRLKSNRSILGQSNSLFFAGKPSVDSTCGRLLSVDPSKPQFSIGMKGKLIPAMSICQDIPPINAPYHTWRAGHSLKQALFVFDTQQGSIWDISSGQWHLDCSHWSWNPCIPSLSSKSPVTDLFPFEVN